MASPVDIESCYTAILDAHQLVEMSLMKAEDFDEMRMALLQIARKYAQVCLAGKLRADDLE